MTKATTTDAASRPYRMRKRREDVEETRRRIVEAAVELHGSVGPAHTTFSAVADTAGVQRSTVYRHFPDEAALFGACTSHWLARHPWPQPDDWRTEPDAGERLARGVRDLYRYYERNEAMISNSLRDISVMPAFVGELMRAQIASMHETLTETWPDDADERALSAGVAHALDFGSWQSLTRAGLSTDEAADLMASMVASVAP
jgi:AcrR family transcriptional regulator